MKAVLMDCRIYKDKYMPSEKDGKADDGTPGRSRSMKRKEKEEERRKKPRDKSRTRTIFGRKKEKETLFTLES